MVELAADAFGRLDESPLRWRWTDPRWSQLPPAILGTIRPLAPDRAGELSRLLRALASELWAQCHAASFGAGARPADSFTEPALLDASQAGAEPVRGWLRERGGDPGEIVAVLWDGHPETQLGVLTPWRAFCTYWDDFCYPGSDDLTVAPGNGAWLLCYHHEEVYAFGRRRLAEPVFRFIASAPG